MNGLAITFSMTDDRRARRLARVGVAGPNRLRLRPRRAPGHWRHGPPNRRHDVAAAAVVPRGLAIDASGNIVIAGDQYIGLDRFGRLIDQNWLKTAAPTPTTTDRFQYGFDRGSDVLFKNNLISSSNSELYHANSTASGDNNAAYDPLQRLTGFRRGTLSASSNNGGIFDTVSSAGRTQTYGLDSIGNQNSVTTNGTAVTRTVNSRNQLTGDGSATLTYDNNGNTTTDQSGKKYGFDAWNHVITVKNASNVTIETFGYDAYARRIIENPGTATDLYYSNIGQVLEQRQGSTVTSQNIWGADYVNDLVLRDDNSTSGSLGISGSGLGQRLYAQHDANFDVTALTSSSGSVVQRFVYDPYGAVTVLSPSWGSTTDAYNWKYMFQGMRFDPVTGLFGTPNRDLNPATDTWLEADSAYFDGSSLYQGFASNPSTYVDPSGQFAGMAAGHQVRRYVAPPPAPANGAAMSMAYLQQQMAQAKTDGQAASSSINSITNVRDAVAGFGDGAVPGYQYLRENLGSDFAANENSTVYAGGHLGGTVFTTVASFGVEGTGLKVLDEAWAASKGLRIATRGVGGGLAVFGAVGVYQQGRNAASNWPCDKTKAIIQGADAAFSAAMIVAGLRGMFRNWGCFPAGTQVQMVEEAPAEAAGTLARTAPGRKEWDWRYVQAVEACVIIGAAGYYLLWDHRRRRFLAMAKDMLDAVAPIELPLYPAPSH